MSDDIKAALLEAWLNRVRQKCRCGAVEHGNKSFGLRGEQVLEEIRDELADVCGWSHILDMRLSRLAPALQRMEALVELQAACVDALAEFAHRTQDVGAPPGTAALHVVSRVRDALERAGVPAVAPQTAEVE